MESLQEFIQNINRPLIIAHRGSKKSNLIPENTLSAFKEARELGADGIELDVRLSRNGELMVFHDSTLRRLLGINKKVRSLDSDELVKLKFPLEQIGSVHYMPTLGKLFTTFGDTLFYNIEVKRNVGSYEYLVIKLHETISKFMLKKNVWVSSFDPKFLRQWIKIKSHVPAGYLFEQWNYVTRYYCAKLPVSWLHPEIGLKRCLKELSGFKKWLCFWNVNDEQDLRDLKDNNIDGLITDDVPLSRKIFIERF